MYGTIARLRVKPGMEDQLVELHHEFDAAQVPGAVAEYVYRMDDDPSEYYLVVIFESREAYFANADSPEQDERYRKFVKLLAEEPEWHDGEIVHAGT